MAQTPQVNERDNFIWLLIALVFLLFSGAVFAQVDSHQGQRLVNISLMPWSSKTASSAFSRPRPPV